MLKESIKSLKSGTDIRGVALKGVEGEKVSLDDETIKRIARGFLNWLKNYSNKEYSEMKIAVGHDSRLSAECIKTAFFQVLLAYDVTVLDCGLATTPSMFMTTIDLACDASVEITASHHPFNKNGFKFFTKAGGLNSSDIDYILENATDDFTTRSLKSVDKIVKVDYTKTYANRLKNLICKELHTENNEPLKGLKIVVDAGNGAGGFFATEILAPLGADITGSQFLEPDGHFPNHVPNPEDKAAMAAIKAATLSHQADLGIIFDTDVDRAGAVDSSGEEINRNNLIAIAATIALEGIKNGTVVTDSVTSNGLRQYIQKELGGQQNRFKRGYKNVINKAILLNSEGINCPLAIETSGHAAMRENYFLDDGAYLVTKMIILLVKLKKKGQTFKNILKKVPQPKESIEYRLKISTKNFKNYGETIIKKFAQFAEAIPNWSIATDSKEGVKFDICEENGDSWVLMRMSVHDPILVINAESDIENYTITIKNILNSFLNQFSDIEKIV